MADLGPGALDLPGHDKSLVDVNEKTPAKLMQKLRFAMKNAGFDLEMIDKIRPHFLVTGALQCVPKTREKRRHGWVSAVFLVGLYMFDNASVSEDGLAMLKQVQKAVYIRQKDLSWSR